MGTEWMGRYRPLVAELVRHSNCAQRASSNRTLVAEGISLNAQEWQVFEYIIEHSDGDAYMNLMSDRLGIAQSTFSKIVKSLCEHGLVDKYQTTRNRKNIILRPSDKGLQVYREHSVDLSSLTFESFFSSLETFSDEQIAQFTAALRLLNDSLSSPAEPMEVELKKL